MKMVTNIRHCWGCQGCWAREYNALGELVCRADMFEKNRPAFFHPWKKRYELTGANNRWELMAWKCEYRYSYLEISYMRSGQWRKAGVTQTVGEKVMEKVNRFYYSYSSQFNFETVIDEKSKLYN